MAQEDFQPSVQSLKNKSSVKKNERMTRSMRVIGRKRLEKLRWEIYFDEDLSKTAIFLPEVFLPNEVIEDILDRFSLITDVTDLDPIILTYPYAEPHREEFYATVVKLRGLFAQTRKRKEDKGRAKNPIKNNGGERLTKSMRAVGQKRLEDLRWTIYRKEDLLKTAFLPPEIFLPEDVIEGILDQFALITDVTYLDSIILTHTYAEPHREEFYATVVELRVVFAQMRKEQEERSRASSRVSKGGK